MRARVVVGDQEHFVQPDRPLTFGRSRDCTVCLDPDDASLSRTAGELAYQQGTWWLTNRSGTWPMSVVDDLGLRNVLPSGRRTAIEAPTRVLIDGAGGRRHSLLIQVDVVAPEVVAPAGAGTPTATGAEVLVNAADRLAMVALFAGYLDEPPRYDPYPKSYAAAAARLGWSQTSLRKRHRVPAGPAGRGRGTEHDRLQRPDQPRRVRGQPAPGHQGGSRAAAALAEPVGEGCRFPAMPALPSVGCGDRHLPVRCSPPAGRSAMTVIGGEIGQLYGLKTSFERQSASVDALLRELRGQLNDTYWSGGAADRFRAAWQSEYCSPTVRRALCWNASSGTPATTAQWWSPPVPPTICTWPGTGAGWPGSGGCVPACCWPPPRRSTASCSTCGYRAAPGWPGLPGGDCW